MAKKKKASVKRAVAAAGRAARAGRESGAVVVKEGGSAGVQRQGGVEDDERGLVMYGPLPCPVATDPAMGDKTPAVMAWYREHRPEEFARRYGNRVFPGVGEMAGGRGDDGERGPVSDFEEEEDEVVMKPRVIMG
jgi:hypothetical protein